MKALASSAVLNSVSADHCIAGPLTLCGLSRGEAFFLGTNDENCSVAFGKKFYPPKYYKDIEKFPKYRYVMSNIA
jgi:hypothetical protein